MATGYAFPTGVEDGFQVELENGVTYEFRAEFQRWDVVKGTGNSVWITDELPDEQYTSNGDLWFDNTADTMQLFLWHEESGAWLPVAPPTTLEGRVEAGEATQQAIIAQIQESLAEQAKLQNKVNALEGVLGEHSFIFTTTNKNPRPGEFALLDGGMNSTNSIDTADYIAMSDVDANGKGVNLDRVVENDVIRMGSIEGGSAELRVTDATGGLYKFDRLSGDLNRLSEMPHDFVLLSSFDPAGLATIEYVDAQDSDLQTKINGKIGKSGNQTLEAGEWRIKQPRSSGGTASFVVINDNVMNLYHVAYPQNGEHAANMQYVDDKIAAIPEPDLSGYATEEYVDDQIAAIPAPSGVPVGCIMIWMNSTAPDGWLKLHGATFDVTEYPELHSYLEGTNGYVSGRLPDWSGHYPGEYGDHLQESNPALGKKVGHMTARPAGEAPYHPNPIPNGNTRTFTATGGTNAYSNGTARPAITEGWDDTTRPKTVIVHYIIKAKP